MLTIRAARAPDAAVLRTMIRELLAEWDGTAAGYKALGAEFCDEWRRVLLTGEGLRRLAESTL